MKEDLSKNNSAKSMAKSSGIVAFVQVFQMVFGLIRNKAISLLIGAAGFGVWSLFQTFIQMVSQFSILGLDRSGVREIARNTDNKKRIEECIFVFRSIILFLSLVCGIIVILLSKYISYKLFNSYDYVWGVRFISLTIILTGIAQGGYSILNGMRKMRYLAFSQIIGCVVGSIGSVVLIWIGGVKFVPFALTVSTLCLAIATSAFVKKIGIRFRKTTKATFVRYAKQLLYLGMGFTVAGLISTIMTLLSRGYLSSHYDLSAVGIYQASWTISNLYTGIILSAMGIDFLPRISRVASDNRQMNELINQQIEFGITFAVIGISTILIFSHIILQLLYSSEFTVGTSIIRWQILGVTLRVIAFPFSFAIIAKAKPVQYAITQIVFWTGDYLLLMLFSSFWGFDALGFNYPVAYSAFLLLVYLANKHNNNFTFKRSTLKVIIKQIVFVAVAFLIGNYIGNVFLRYTIGIIVISLQFIVLNRYMKDNLSINFLTYIKNKIRK